MMAFLNKLRYGTGMRCGFGTNSVIRFEANVGYVVPVDAILSGSVSVKSEAGKAAAGRAAATRVRPARLGWERGAAGNLRGRSTGSGGSSKGATPMETGRGGVGCELGGVQG